MSTDAEPQPLVDVRRLLGRVAIGLLLAADAGIVWSAARAPLINPDTYFHLRFGEEFLHHWSIAHPGQPNAASTASWVPTQWLGQVVWAWVYDHGGAPSLGLLSAVLITTLMVAVYAAARTASAPRAAFVATSAVLIASSHWLGLRPQLISFVLIAVSVLLWIRARASGRVPWLLVPLTWLWAMCHGMWILGIAIGLVAAVALAVEERDRNRTLQHFAVPVASLGAACLTPVGPRLLGAVLEVNGRASHFAEWAPVPLLQGWGLPVAALVGSAVVLRMRRGGTRPYELAMVVLALLFATYSGRTVVAALIVVAPVLAGDLRRRGTTDVRRRTEVGLAGVLVAGGLVAGLVAAASPRPGLDADVRPFSTVLASLPPGTVVLTDRTYGAVLLFRYPALEVPLHGYGDVFTDAELDRYDGLTTLQPGWIATLRRLDARVALLAPDSDLAYALTGRGWRVTRHHGHLELLVAPSSAAGRPRA